MRKLHSDLLSKGYSEVSIGERLAIQAATLLIAYEAKNSAVSFHLGWSPDFKGADSENITSGSLTLEQAQEAIAREYGYSDWSQVEVLQGKMLDVEFERAVDAVIEGDIAQLQSQLSANPELVAQKSQYAHRSTLLHYVGANGVESHRQITPLNAPDVARCLILAGADVNAKAEMYGGSTALELVVTSAHPHNAGVAAAIADVLKEAGAK